MTPLSVVSNIKRARFNQLYSHKRTIFLLLALKEQKKCRAIEFPGKSIVFSPIIKREKAAKNGQQKTEQVSIS